MSKLGKNLLYVALVGALVAIGAGVALVMKYSDTKATLTQTETDKEAAVKATTKAKAETAAALQAKNDSDTKLTAANSHIDDLNNQLTAAQQQAKDAATAMQAAKDQAKIATDNLDTITKSLNGETADQLRADTAKAQADATAAQNDEKIMADKLQASQMQVADLNDEIKRSKTGAMPPLSGKITFVDSIWNFVVLNVGLTNGVVPNGELTVYRGGDRLGTIKVTRADPNDAVAEIGSDIKGNIQVGDTVLN
jgi:multidrug efflux pump subunit AcrA (membrane-fusion protein)